MCGIGSYGCGSGRNLTCSPVMISEEHVIPIVPSRPRSIPVRKDRLRDLRDDINFDTLISVNIQRRDEVIYYISYIGNTANNISYFDLLDTTMSIKEEDLINLFKEFGKEIKITGIKWDKDKEKIVIKPKKVQLALENENFKPELIDKVVRKLKEAKQDIKEKEEWEENYDR